MKTAQDIYGASGGSFCEQYEYGPMLDAIGTVVVRDDDNDYQGNSRVLLRMPDGRWGLLDFDWGSCSGCDPLQGCDTYADIDELLESLRNGVTVGDAPAIWTIIYDNAAKSLDGWAGFKDKCETYLASQ
jgi:hypothetical protein